MSECEKGPESPVYLISWQSVPKARSEPSTPFSVPISLGLFMSSKGMRRKWIVGFACCVMICLMKFLVWAPSTPSEKPQMGNLVDQPERKVPETPRCLIEFKKGKEDPWGEQLKMKFTLSESLLALFVCFLIHKEPSLLTQTRFIFALFTRKLTSTRKKENFSFLLFLFM